MTVFINASGRAAAVYDDTLAPVLRGLGPSEIKRASRVEPAGGWGWEADLTPSHGPVGVFPTRGEALAFESRWLHDALRGK